MAGVSSVNVSTSIIIPCYIANDHLMDLSVNCINSLLNTTKEEPSQVLIVNDGSPVNWEMDEDTRVKLISRQENGGYAQAVNTGLFYASGDVIIISNNDIQFVDPHWLDELIRPLTEGYGISSIRTTDSDGWSTEDKLEDDAKFGSIWAMTRETYEELGNLDESYGRGYFEDLAYWHAARKAGIKICKNHNALVEHVGHATFDTLDTVPIYYQAMLNYRMKHDDSILIKQPTEDGSSVIVLVDYYDLAKHSPAIREAMKQDEVSPDEAAERWGLA